MSADGVTMTCPRCGSDDLRTRRGPWARFFLGILAPRNLVECQSCRWRFDLRRPDKSVGPGS